MRLWFGNAIVWTGFSSASVLVSSALFTILVTLSLSVLSTTLICAVTTALILLPLLTFSVYWASVALTFLKVTSESFSVTSVPLMVMTRTSFGWPYMILPSSFFIV